MTSFIEFREKFNFIPENAFKLGLEREFFLADRSGEIVPQAKVVYEELERRWGNLFTYELSACQIESRTQVIPVESLVEYLKECEEKLDNVLSALGLQKLYLEVAPDTMPLDVYPDSSGRYAQISRQMPKEVLLAACQVAGTHVHVGMPDIETALRVYNHVIRYCDELCTMGDGSEGRRLRIYKKVSPDCVPYPYETWQNFYDTAVARGFAEEPRNCWTLIRITKHGTIEFRMFGVTQSIERIAQWAMRCRNLCLRAVTPVD